MFQYLFFVGYVRTNRIKYFLGTFSLAATFMFPFRIKGLDLDFYFVIIGCRPSNGSDKDYLDWQVV